MSEMEKHIGRLVKTDKTMEEIVDEWIAKGNVANYDKVEVIFYYDVEDYIDINDEIYEIVSRQLDEYCEFRELIMPQEEPVFVLEFYNGGGTLKDAIYDLYREK